jgi:hypothetical protein
MGNEKNEKQFTKQYIKDAYVQGRVDESAADDMVELQDLLFIFEDDARSYLQKVLSGRNEATASEVHIDALVSDNRRWKSVDEVLPEFGNLICVYGGKWKDAEPPMKKVKIGYLDRLDENGYKWIVLHKRGEEDDEEWHGITHWKPLPKPPE